MLRFGCWVVLCKVAGVIFKKNRLYYNFYFLAVGLGELVAVCQLVVLCNNLETGLLNGDSGADGLRDMQGLAVRFFGGRSAAEPGVAQTEAVS